MKKIFLLLMFFAGTYFVKAIELTYSEWSEEYPKGVDEILIESEDRYIWYKETIYDEEYLIKEKAEEKIYDENDYIYYESEELSEKPDEYSERKIMEYDKLVVYNSNDVYGLKLQSENDVRISEIVIYDENRKLINFNSEFSYLSDGIKDIYYPLNNELIINFNDNYDMNKLKIYVYYNYYGNEKGHLKANVITKNEDIIYYANYYYNFTNNYGCTFDINSNVLISDFNHNKKVYVYIDKLYKSYRIIREYTSEYVKELEDYEKDIESKKTFYRYITNKFLIFDISNNIVTNESYCDKEFCMIVFFDQEPPKEEPIVEEPPKEEPIVEEPPKEEPIVEEPPKEEPIVEEPPKEEEQIVEEPPKEEEPVVEELPKEEEPVVEELPKEEIIDKGESDLLNELIINPKTYDPLYDYIILLIVSSIAIVYFIVEKSRAIKKSNNVESI